MLNREREHEIISILKAADGFVTVHQLCERLFASESSIRRDLKALEAQGLVRRSYGGAALAAGALIGSFDCRTRQNISEKCDIAKKAAGMIQDGEVIFLDQSSTSFYLARELMNKSSVTVVTNNIEILMLLSGTELRVLSSGGYLSSENRNCLIGGDAQDIFSQIHADHLFFSVKAISEEGAVMDCSREEIIVRNVMLRNSRSRVLLCDSSKFGQRACFQQCTLADVDCLISEGSSAGQFSGISEKLMLL